MRLWRFLKAVSGADDRNVSVGERLTAGLGGFVGILTVITSSTLFLDGAALYAMVGSMGASAVLLFAVPHGPMSQPWAVFGGHMLSALVGVSMAQMVPSVFLAAPLAAGVAISVMHFTRCIHPPGGATALIAVIGGASVESLGYGFVLFPVATNAVAILLAAVAFGFAFPKRRYPRYLHERRMAAEEGAEYQAIRHEDFVYALSQMDAFVDVSEADLLRIYDLATRRSYDEALSVDVLKPGASYSNGRSGKHWSVRQIIDWEADGSTSEPRLIYKIVAGHGKHATRLVTRQEFAQWARHQVRLIDGHWAKVEPDK